MQDRPMQAYNVFIFCNSGLFSNIGSIIGLLFVYSHERMGSCSLEQYVFKMKINMNILSGVQVVPLQFQRVYSHAVLNEYDHESYVGLNPPGGNKSVLRLHTQFQTILLIKA